MGMTAVQKILSIHADGRAVQPGELLWVKIDWACIDDVQWPVFKSALTELGNRIVDREKAIVIADHYSPPSTVDEAETVKELREFAEVNHLPHAFFDRGVKHQVLLESGLIRPGDIAVATDSHIPTIGAAGALGIALGPTEVAGAFAFGEVWLRVPATIRIILQGSLPPMVFSKDVALYILQREGSRFGNYRAIEFAGPLVNKLDFSDRMTLCNMVTEMGAKTAFIEPPSIISQAGSDTLGRFIGSDADAPFEREISLDVNGLEPLVAAPHSPSNVDVVTKFRHVKIDQAFIGSCANATYEDLAIVARILRGRRVARGVQMIVTPSSLGAYQKALADGFIETILSAGAIVTNPGCGACAGLHMGVLGPGQVRISSQNRNFVGRGGHPSSRIYLASPAVVAASAVTGYITDPRDVL